MATDAPFDISLSGVTAGRAAGDQVGDLRSLYRLTDRLYRAPHLAEVYEAALDVIVETLGCGRASILLFDQNGTMRFVAWRGLSERYRRALEGHSPWKPGDRDPEPIFVADIGATSEPDRVKDVILAEGIRALGFIPLVAKGAVVGKFMTYHAAPHAFEEHEIQVAVTIARQVGFSIERARAEAELRESEQRFRLMVEHAPVMIWMSDAKGDCLHINRMLRSFWGVPEEASAGFDWRSMLHPEDAPEVRRLVEAAIAAGSPVRLTARFRNADGAWRVVQTEAHPRLSQSGVFLGLIGVNVDVTERETAAQALRQSEERFRLAVEAAPSGMVMTDGMGRIVLVNANAETLTGYTRGELEGRPVELLVPDRFRASHPDSRAAYGHRPRPRAMGEASELFLRRKDGSEVAVEIGLSPITAPDGPMAIAAIVDISGRKRAEAQRELLLAELNHRVKNTLAVVQAMAHQTFRGAAPAATQAFEGRLAALARAHDRLTHGKWENASLEQLAADALQIDGEDAPRVALSGPPVLVTPKQALSLTMALHELLTNAVKYGALSKDRGRVTVDWRWLPGRPRRLRIVWRERDGPPIDAPGPAGFGTLLLRRALAYDLDGTVTTDFARSGLVCTIEAPIAPEPAR